MWGAACAPPPRVAEPPAQPAPAAVGAAARDAFLDELEERTFRFFWERADPATGLVADRWPTESFASIAATGFGLTADLVGVERGWVSRAEARQRVLATLRFLWRAPQGPQPRGTSGYRGFFYHFLDPATGERFETVELSSIDTTLLLAGVLACRGWFDGDDPAEAEIRDLARRIYERVEWTWLQPRAPLVAMGWKPEEGFLGYDWHGYDEAMLLYLLALGSPTHPVAAEAWEAYSRTYRWERFQGYEFVQFGPLFGHQYSHVWVDFRDLRDAFMRAHDSDYFENSRRATLAQRAWAIANPRGWEGLGPEVWGITACDGPADLEHDFHGEKRRFWTYAARGLEARFDVEDGTVAPTAAGGSVPFAPDEAIAALMEMRRRWGAELWGEYGFRDAFNPSFDFTDVAVHHGRVVPGVGWFDGDWLGIDQGPILLMIENHRSGRVWEVMRRDPDLRRGLERAGFTGGWLDGAPG